MMTILRRRMWNVGFTSAARRARWRTSALITRLRVTSIVLSRRSTTSLRCRTNQRRTTDGQIVSCWSSPYCILTLLCSRSRALLVAMATASATSYFSLDDDITASLCCHDNTHDADNGMEYVPLQQ